MLKKSLFVIMMLFLLLQGSYASDVKAVPVSGSNDWFDLGTGIGINGGFGYGFEALIEYRFSEKTSLYIIGNMMKDMEAMDSDNHDYDMETGDSKMVGIQLRLLKYFSIGYHAVTNHKQTSNVIQKATSAYSWGLLSSKKDWEWGLMVYEFNDKARNGESSSSGGFFLRKKFFF